MSDDNKGSMIGPTYIVVTDATTGWKRPIHFDVVEEALRINAALTPKPFDLAMLDQHHGRDCCESCLEDEQYDSIYSLYPNCCCRSEIPTEWLEARMKAGRP
jgi:hypothetical protein